jgi:hypothetical protein
MRSAINSQVDQYLKIVRNPKIQKETILTLLGHVKPIRDRDYI